MTEIRLLNGDCFEQLKTIPDNSIDALVTDPPAGIGFMGKEWDKDKGGRDGWIAWLESVMVEAKRTMKPGAHGLVWALPRTSHWTATALEDAGFEVRDCVYHVFGSGFPKSLNVGKAIDKMQGNDREELGLHPMPAANKQGGNSLNMSVVGMPDFPIVTKGHSVWEGWGTALKPAVECWWLVRKPLEESTVAKNVLEYGTGAINIDATRIEFDSNSKEDNHAQEQWARQARSGVKVFNQEGDAKLQTFDQSAPSGRWPSHLIHDGSDEVLEHFPQTKDGVAVRTNSGGKNFGSEQVKPVMDNIGYGGSGSAARFFYCAKPSKAERNAKLSGFDEKPSSGLKGTEDQTLLTGSGNIRDNMNTNHHPTVKGQALMRYLITLITPPDGTVLDMFMGSGSTGVAAKALGFGFVGVELEPDYFEIAKARIGGTRVGEHLDFKKSVEVDESQLDLFDMLGEEK